MPQDTNNTPTPQYVKRMIELLPVNSLPVILNHVVLECLKRNAFNNKAITPVVASLEKTFGGK